MKWLYGEERPAAWDKTILHSYKVNPNDIIAVELNNKYFISKHLGALYYRQEDEPIILDLVNNDANKCLVYDNAIRILEEIDD